MTSAHRGQILPLKKQLIPISRDTVFHANFDRDLYGYNGIGKRIEPIGYQSSINFDGNTGYVEIPHSDLLNCENTVTIELWFRTSATHRMSLISKHYNDYEIAIEGSTIWTWFGDGNTYRAASRNINVNMTDNRWHHLSVSINKALGEIYYLLDGVSYQMSGEIPPLTGTGSFDLYIGGRNGGQQYFRGFISDVRIWNHMRPEYMIINNMNKELSGNESGLIGYWKLNEREGDIAQDYSLNENEGIIKPGSTWDIGRTIVTLRPFDGKYGGAVSIEESTINLLTNTSFTSIISSPHHLPTGWNVGSGGNGDPAFMFNRSIIPGRLGGNIFRADVTESSVVTDRYFVISNGISVTENLPYTWSAYVRSNKPGVRIRVRMYNSSNQVVGSDIGSPENEYDTPNEWKRISFTSIIPPTVAYIIFYVRTWGHNTGDWIEIEAPQMEQKTFMTSYVNGSRPFGRLLYSKNDIRITPQEGTVHFSFKTKMTSFIKLIRIFTVGTLHASNVTPRILICQTSASEMACYFNTNGVRQYLNFPPFVDGMWHTITISWKSGDKLLAFFDGIKTRDLAFNSTYNDFDTDIAFSHEDGGTEANHWIDEVRMESRFTSEDEILSWHQSKTPFYNYLDYSNGGE